MSKKKSEAFEAETQILVKARETLEKSSDDADALRQAYASICDEYERLLEEARFLTKVSDKLEVKLNKANEQLEAHNKQLSSEKELVENEMGRALKTNKKLREECGFEYDDNHRGAIGDTLQVAGCFSGGVPGVTFAWAFNAFASYRICRPGFSSDVSGIEDIDAGECRVVGRYFR